MFIKPKMSLIDEPEPQIAMCCAVLAWGVAFIASTVFFVYVWSELANTLTLIN